MDISVKTDLSDGDLRRIVEAVATRIEARNPPRLAPAALKAADAARYLGIGRSTFYACSRPTLD